MRNLEINSTKKQILSWFTHTYVFALRWEEIPGVWEKKNQTFQFLQLHILCKELNWTFRGNLRCIWQSYIIQMLKITVHSQVQTLIGLES